MSIALLNPFWYTSAAPMVTRTFFDAGFTATPTTISTTQTAHKSITTTETSGDEFAFFYQAVLDHEGTASDVNSILFESPTNRQQFNLESQDITDQHSVGGCYAYTGGTARTISLDSDEESAATNEIQDYALCALKLDAADRFAYSAAQDALSSSTYSAKLNGIFLQASKEYLVIASASVLQSAAGIAKVRVLFQSDVLKEESGTFYAQDTTNWTPFFMVKKVVTGEILGSGELKMEWARVGATGTATIREASIVALDLSKFENYYYAEQFTDQTTTSTTVFGGTGLSNTFSITNPSNYHLLIAGSAVGSSATNRSTVSRLFNTTASVDYSGEHRREANAITERYPGHVGQIVTFSSASQTIAWQHYIAGGAGTSTIGDMAIAILDLGVAPTAANPVFQSAETAIGVGNSISVTKPASIAVDDLLIAAIAVEKGTGETITATGWSLIRRENQSTNVGIGIYYKIAVSGDTGAGSFSFTLANGSKWSAAVMRITNHDPDTPIEANNGQNSGTATTAHVAPAITTGTVLADSLVLSFYAGKAQGAYTPAASTTEMYDRPNTTDSQPAHMGAYEIQASTGNTSSRTATCATSTEYVGVQIVINPVL